MKKYDIVLLNGQKEDFLEQLQELGLVDITTTGWEPDERERELMVSIDKHRAAVARLKELLKDDSFEAGKPYSTPNQAWEGYTRAAKEVDTLTASIAALEKEIEETEVWGQFDPQAIAELEKSGIRLHWFSAYTKEFQSQLPAMQEQYTVVPINESGGTTYFVVIPSDGGQVHVNAQEQKQPTVTAERKRAQLEALEKQKAEEEKGLARAAASIDLIEKHADAESAMLHLSKAAKTGQEEAEGTLVIMEGWATRETEEKVDKMLEGYPNLIYLKADPTPEDDTPTLLKNNKFNSMFELIGNFYSKPKYGTLDLTRFFGPFYALFFGLCLADAGYGLLYFLAGLILTRKVKEQYKGITRLLTLLGFSTMVCGTFLGSFFGIELGKVDAFSSFHKYIISSDNMFVLAIAIGVVQILFGMVLKVINLTRQYGFRHALSTIGWMIVILSSLAFFQEKMGIHLFTMSQPVYFVCLGIGLFMMLFLNSPGKNPLMNFGLGLWDTYNNVTGILGDALSYIRLFAIGLSGGILAQVFNMLATGLSPDIAVVKQIVMVFILLIGHGLTLFMGSLSAFVHPMRLTFVEFYNNSGFEATQREFTPLKKEKRNE